MIVRPAKNAQLAPSIWVKALERLIITIANKLKLPVFLTKKGQTISHFQRRKLNMWPGLKYFDNWINYITNHWESNDLYFKLYKPKFKDDLLTICLPQGRHPNLWQLFVQVFFQSEKKSIEWDELTPNLKRLASVQYVQWNLTSFYFFIWHTFSK